jgi:hypothetical protein
MKFEYNLIDRKTYTYTEYRALIDSLSADNKTTGDNHSEAMLGHTSMNITRMNRLDKKTVINEELASKIKASGEQTWVVLSEAWCGDAAQNLPYLNKLAELNPKITLTIILRDKNLDIMDDFLTNGGRSIPKVIALDPAKYVLFQWGPRPEVMQTKYNALKKDGLEYAEISKTIHTMYAKDKGVAVQSDFLALL